MNPAFFLQLGLAFVFAFAGIDALREPAAWIAFVPEHLPLLSRSAALDVLSAAQIGLALKFLYRPTAAYAAVLGGGLLAGTVVLNGGSLLVTFRDAGLVFACAALVAATWPERLKLTGRA